MVTMAPTREAEHRLDPKKRFHTKEDDSSSRRDERAAKLSIGATDEYSREHPNEHHEACQAEVEASIGDESAAR
jgi:hypothetical protein